MEKFISELSILLVIAAGLSSLAVIFKQPIIVAYIVSGILIGPWGLGWVENIEFIEAVSHLGITLLLFLAGLSLHPQKLFQLFRETSFITIANCIISFVISFALSWAFGFSFMESICISLALMFSSTILVVKLLPTTKLHQERMGAVCIGILIMQDLLAVAVLAFIRCLTSPAGAWESFLVLNLKLAGLIAVLIVFEQFILHRIMQQVDRLHEVLFVLGLAWCFGIASLSHQMGLFYESGAFFAGVVLARQAVSRFIADKLRPLRDFFLVLFFFSLGAKLNLEILKGIFHLSLAMAVLFVIIKPLMFAFSFRLSGENKPFAEEAGFRLGQFSEFSLLIALLALSDGIISSRASQFIQLTTILTFVISSYLVVLRYPTPIGLSEKMTKD